MADPHLIQYLADRNVPCPACTYNLRGLQSDRCPECNREVVLQIRLAEPRMGAWIASLVAVCAMLGFNGLLSLYFLIFVVRRGGGSRDWAIASALFISTGVAAVALTLLVRLRRRFCNLTFVPRASLTAVAWALTAISTIYFFAFAR